MSKGIKAKAKADAKKAQKEQEEILLKMSNEGYRPEQEVVLSGSAMSNLLFFAKRVLNARTINVLNGKNEAIGYGVLPRDEDVTELYRFVLGLHQKQVQEGNTITFDVLRVEMEDRAREELAQQGQQSDTPSAEAEVSLEGGEVDQPSDIAHAVEDIAHAVETPQEEEETTA